MIDKDLTLVDIQIRRVLAKEVERFAVIVLDELAALVVVAEERPEEVAGTCSLGDCGEECRYVVASVLRREDDRKLGVFADRQEAGIRLPHQS